MYERWSLQSKINARKGGSQGTKVIPTMFPPFFNGGSLLLPDKRPPEFPAKNYSWSRAGNDSFKSNRYALIVPPMEDNDSRDGRKELEHPAGVSSEFSTGSLPHD